MTTHLTTKPDSYLSIIILPLMYWLELHDILYLVKALKFPSDNMPILRYIFFSKSNTQSSCRNRLQHNYCRTSVSRHFYFHRIVRLWNKIPSIVQFLNQIQSYLSSVRTLTFILILQIDAHIIYLCPCSSCVVQ